MRLRHNAARLQMRICVRARSQVGGGGHSDRESKGADEAGPPDERATSVGWFHFQSCFSASICLTGAAVLIMKPPAANTTADAF